jgi:hypothetical protein
MSNIDTLLSLFKSGHLVSPSADVLNSIDLFRAVATLAGADGIGGGDNVERLVRMIGISEHYVLIIVDGLGMSLIEDLTGNSFFRERLSTEIRAVFPPTTAAVLTSLATAQWPCTHSMPGWFVYLYEIKETAVSLPFVERFSERPLEKYGLNAGDVFPSPSVWARVKHEPLTIIKSKLANSTYTKYSSGETERIGYEGILDAADLVRKRVLNAVYPTFTYLYLPQLDAICHEKGKGHPDTRALLKTLDGMLSHLCRDLAGKARIIITADHGLIDTPKNERIVIEEGDPLLDYLLCPPTVEPRVPAFHVKEGHEERFYRDFSSHFAEHFILITPDEAEHLKLFGPGPLSPLIRRRLGTFIGIPLRAAALYYRSPGYTKPPFAAVHAGLSHDEMVVPLILT